MGFIQCSNVYSASAPLASAEDEVVNIYNLCPISCGVGTKQTNLSGWLRMVPCLQPGGEELVQWNIHSGQWAIGKLPQDDHMHRCDMSMMSMKMIQIRHGMVQTYSDQTWSDIQLIQLGPFSMRLKWDCWIDKALPRGPIMFCLDPFSIWSSMILESFGLVPESIGQWQWNYHLVI